MGFSCKLVPQYDPANLFDLIGFGFRTYRLKIEDFFNTRFREDVMTASYSFIKAEMPQ